jgi:hypothetical protein
MTRLQRWQAAEGCSLFWQQTNTLDISFGKNSAHLRKDQALISNYLKHKQRVHSI